jgi:hypothetical protein
MKTKDIVSQLANQLCKDFFFKDHDMHIDPRKPLATRVFEKIFQTRDIIENPTLHRKLSLFSQLDASPANGNPLTDLQQSITKGFVGFRN